MLKKSWIQSPSPPIGFAEYVGLSPFKAHLLYNRGIRRKQEIDSFLTADHSLANDPALIPDMDKAIERLKTAISTGETVGVFGDFDTDGITGTSIIVKALSELGIKTVPYLPNRMSEGHGLNMEAVRFLHAHGVTLLITVDCGVSSSAEIEFASSMGIDTIITDHHSLPTNYPQARAILNPSREDSKYPYDGLTGVGIAFKLIEGLWATLNRSWPDHFLELVALGTVADVGPLTGENRHLVKQGIKNLNTTQNPGLKALIARAGLKRGNLDTESLSFQLIPRLNSAGRMSDPSVSLDLLTTASDAVAENIAERLELHNTERRRVTQESLKQAYHQAQERYDQTSPIIIVEHPDWLPGILGLIAANLCDRFYRPAVAIAVEGEMSRGSARSIPEFNVIQILKDNHTLFERYGGHARAAGFTIPTDKLPLLKHQLQAASVKQLDGTNLNPSIQIDFEIEPSLLKETGNMEFIQSLSPHGEGNPAPIFLTRKARIVTSRQVGRNKNHLKMEISHGGNCWDAIAFWQGDTPASSGNKIDMVYTPGIKEWGGRRTLQLNILDFETEHRISQPTILNAGASQHGSPY